MSREKTPNQIAREIWENFCSPTGHSERLIDEIAEALLKHGEEVRAETLEEAAKIANDFRKQDIKGEATEIRSFFIAQAIRNQKGGKG